MPLLINAYCTVRTVPPRHFPHQLLGERDRTDPQFKQHLSEFVDYVMKQAGGQMTYVAYHVMRHIQRVKRQCSFNVEDEDLDAVTEWLEQANGIAFLPDGSIRDPQGEQLLPESGADEAARVPYPLDARERKHRTDRQLSSMGVHIVDGLPPVVGEMEVELRPDVDVAKRCLALFVAAVRAESVASLAEIPIADLENDWPLGIAALSPAERRFVYSAGPSPQDVINFAWRYECLLVLEWALGLIEDLPLATSICDVARVAKIAIDNNSADFLHRAHLRRADEILDALDFHFRLHWAVRQARSDPANTPLGADPGVMHERHYALNWLVRFEDKDWDDIDTPT